MKALDYLQETVNGLGQWQMEKICREVIRGSDFQQSPGGSSHHHNYRGGLLQHTAEVVWAASNLAKNSPIVDFQALITAAVFHDRNKIFEYGLKWSEFDTRKEDVIKKPYRNLIGHVTGSWQYFMSLATGVGLNPYTIDVISHAMLAHHGRLEWRSPVEPLTPEAFMLHSADMLSATGWSGIPKFEI